MQGVEKRLIGGPDCAVPAAALLHPAAKWIHLVSIAKGNLETCVNWTRWWAARIVYQQPTDVTQATNSEWAAVCKTVFRVRRT
jgi:hypothetical protein